MRTHMAIAALATLLSTGGCAAGMRQVASANFQPMVEQFPHHASAPIARELHYSYTVLWILNGKPYGKPIFAADAASMKAKSKYANPGQVITAAMGRSPEGTGVASLSRFGNELSEQGKALSEQGRHAEAIQRFDLAAATRGTEASVQSSINSLQRAEATLNAVVSVYGGLAALGQVLHAKSTHAVGEWIRDSTGFVGPSAPAGTVLNVAFVFLLDAKKWHKESRVDFLAHATLVDSAGAVVESRQGYQMYTVGQAPKITVPDDTVPLVRGPARFPTQAQPAVKTLMQGDIWGPYLGVAIDAALLDLQRQVRRTP